MVKVITEDDHRYRLEDDAGRDIGWILHRVIGFRGFGDEAEAINAAFDAWCALETLLGRVDRTRRQTTVAREKLRLVHDGSAEWVSDGRVPLARVQRPDRTRSRNPSFAIELQLPSHATDGLRIAAALYLAQVLQPHLPADGIAAARQPDDPCVAVAP